MARRDIDHPPGWAFVTSATLVLAVVLSASIARPARASAELLVDKVVIESNWAGLSPDGPFHSRIVIDRVGPTYRLTGSHGNGKRRENEQGVEVPFAARSIPTADVEKLRDAMSAPLLLHVELATLEPEVKHVQRDIDQFLKEADLSGYSAERQQAIRAWRTTLRQPEVLRFVLTAGFEATRYDDYPSMRVELTLSDGSVLVATSDSQQYLMLPWTIGNGATYSPALSRTLALLLPDDATNKQRLTGKVSDIEFQAILDHGVGEDAWYKGLIDAR